MIDRNEFAAIWEKIRPGLGGPESSLWAGEEDGDPVSQWFVNVKQIPTANKPSFWDWVKENMQGKIRCYSSDSIYNEEWWGFADQYDVPLWLLKWA